MLDYQSVPKFFSTRPPFFHHSRVTNLNPAEKKSDPSFLEMKRSLSSETGILVEEDSHVFAGCQMPCYAWNVNVSLSCSSCEVCVPSRRSMRKSKQRSLSRM